MHQATRRLMLSFVALAYSAATLLSGTSVLAVGETTQSKAVVGSPAPAFSMKDTKGKPQALSDYKGKFVVLEWFNFGCPFVKKHYSSGNMQSLQKKYGDKGVIWFSICSSAAGKQGALTAQEANQKMQAKGAAPKAVLLDANGKIGKSYGATATPHMFVIDPKGIVIYAGAIDDHPSTHTEDIPKSKNYVQVALDEAMVGKPVTTPKTVQYGCSIKY